MVRGDQRVAKECYSASMKQKAVDNICLDELEMRDEVLTQPEPSEELEPVQLDDDPEHLAHIGSQLMEELKGPLTLFLRQNKDVFKWKQADMGGIDPTVITHRLNVSPSFKPVKQKRRSFAPEEAEYPKYKLHSNEAAIYKKAKALENSRNHFKFSINQH